ncbi:DUF192 domain-containing protein [Aneurinibacillus sp. REN35]|uniref:DUF192 domain-containing protein n=1 Tax=Aneurinibacillus sp. REN35 TaxID=3237286 RepID=UPI003526D8C6
MLQILNRTKNTVLADRVQEAISKREKTIGLLRHSTLPAGHGLLIPECTSVHTFFMKFAIDVVFIDEHGCVIKQYENVVPFRIARANKAAKSVIELPAYTLRRTNTEVDDRLELISVM